MAKYSTGGVGSSESDSCELCGAEGRRLETTRVAGATLDVCPDCRRHSEDADTDEQGRPTGSRGEEERGRRLNAVRTAARLDDARRADAEHWESGTDYDDDPLPYLVGGYGERVTEARQAAGLDTAELAGELGVEEADVLAVEQGRATRAGVGGSLVRALEERLDVELVEEA
jgi:ribosome-binding protein aMBF1 (putative translation factor)